jgi:hypothetical protein
LLGYSPSSRPEDDSLPWSSLTVAQEDMIRTRCDNVFLDVFPSKVFRLTPAAASLTELLDGSSRHRPTCTVLYRLVLASLPSQPANWSRLGVPRSTKSVRAPFLRCRAMESAAAVCLEHLQRLGENAVAIGRRSGMRAHGIPLEVAQSSEATAESSRWRICGARGAWDIAMFCMTP